MIMGDFTIQFGRLVAYRGSDTEVAVPDGVTCIGRRAFYFAKAASVILPDSVTEIEQEAFLYARLTQIEFGNGIKKIGADAFLCDLDAKKYLYPKLPVAVFAKEDRRRAFYHFVHDAGNGGYTPQVYKRNMDYVRRHLLDEIEYKRVCIDVLEGKPDLLSEVLSGGKIPPKDLENLIVRYSREPNPQMLALLLQNRSAQSKG